MLNISGETTRRALAVLTWPLLQLFFLRVFIHEFLQLRFGFSNITDFDLILPAPIAFVVLWHALEKAGPCSLKLQRKALVVNLIASAVFLLGNNFYEELIRLSPLGTVSMWFVFLGLVITSAFCVFVPPSYYYKNENRFSFLPCTLIGSSLYFYTNGFHTGWSWLGSLTSVSIYGIFKLIPFTQAISYFNANSEVVLEHPLFTASIGKACGGFDSFFYFTIVFLLVHTLYRKALRPSRSVTVYGGGLSLMFTLNLFRIVFLFFLGIGLQKVLPHKTAINLFKLCFHANFGWLLYTAGIFTYLKVSSPFLRQDESFTDLGLPSLEPIPVRERA